RTAGCQCRSFGGLSAECGGVPSPAQSSASGREVAWASARSSPPPRNSGTMVGWPLPWAPSRKTTIPPPIPRSGAVSQSPYEDSSRVHRDSIPARDRPSCPQPYVSAAQMSAILGTLWRVTEGDKVEEDRESIYT